jgi:DNA glycosylase AlkZ-like
MAMAAAVLELSREQILGHRRRVNLLDQRLPTSAESLELAALAGLQDSMPRAALLSIHARVAGTEPATWENSVYVQLWGPRFSAYVVAARDRALFSLGRLPDSAKERRFALDLAARLHAHLDGRRLPYDYAGQALGVHPNSLRYVAPTGTLLLRWEGARRPVIWSVPAPDMEPPAARAELARRYLQLFGPTTAPAFAKWAGIGRREAQAAFEALAGELIAARSPVGDGWILASNESSFQAESSPTNAVRLLPSGDAYWLLHGFDRDLLVPSPVERDRLWTPRVWPGALLVSGEIIGTWRRADSDLSVEVWRRLSPAEHAAVEEEAASLPLPGLARPITVRWDGA